MGEMVTLSPRMGEERKSTSNVELGDISFGLDFELAANWVGLNCMRLGVDELDAFLQSRTHTFSHTHDMSVICGPDHRGGCGHGFSSVKEIKDNAVLTMVSLFSFICWGIGPAPTLH